VGKHIIVYCLLTVLLWYIRENRPMAHPILTEDWTSYDNRKISEEKDKSKFSCSEHWEVEYLADKLRKYYPLKTRQGIMQSITHCCSKISAPHQRERFIECVIRRFVSE